MKYRRHSLYHFTLIALCCVAQLFALHAETTDASIAADLNAKAKQGPLKIADMPAIREIEIPKELKKFFDAISIKDPQIIQKDIGVVITGSTTINNTLVEISATIKVGLDKISTTEQSASAKIKGSLGVMLPASWKFSSLSSTLAAFDLFTFSRVAFVLSTYGYLDTHWQVFASPGVNVMGEVVFDSNSNVAKIVPGINKLIARGSVTPMLTGSSIEGIWPVQLKLSKDIHTTDLTIGASVPAPNAPMPTIYMETGLDVTVPNQTDHLIFRSAFNFSAIDCRLEGAMDGMWRNPLGIKGLEIGNMGIEGTLSYAGLITGIGLRGKVMLGTKSIEVAGVGKVGSDTLFGTVAFMGETNNIYWTDLIKMTAAALTEVSKKKVTLPINVLPNIGFEKIKIYMVPMPTEIAEKMYAQGLTIAGLLSLGITKVAVDMHLNDSGLRAFSTMKKINLGPVKITGDGLDKKAGTQDDGPTLNIQLDGAKQEIYFDGNAQLSILGLNVNSDAHVNLTTRGFEYAVTTDLAALAWDLNVIIGFPDFKDALVKGSMSQSARQQFGTILREGAQAIIDSAKKGINKEAEKNQTKLASLNTTIKNKEKKCKKWDIAACAELTLLYTERAGYQAYDNVILPAGSWSSKIVAAMTNALATITTKAFDVTEISFEAHAKDLTSAILPQVRVKGVFLGKNFNQVMQLNLNDPADAAKKIIEKLKDLFA